MLMPVRFAVFTVALLTSGCPSVSARLNADRCAELNAKRLRCEVCRGTGYAGCSHLCGDSQAVLSEWFDLDCDALEAP